MADTYEVGAPVRRDEEARHNQPNVVELGLLAEEALGALIDGASLARQHFTRDGHDYVLTLEEGTLDD
jgi:hypothetical protein